MRGLRGDRHVTLGAIVVAVCALLVVATMSGTINAFLDRTETREVVAVFDDAQQLGKDDDVRVDGVDAGKVKRTEYDEATRTTRVVMDVDEATGSLFGDARAVLRFKTVLGGSFYVDLERGTPGSGDLRGVIPPSRAQRQVELDDITPVLRGDAERGLRKLPAELTAALADPEAPASTLDAVADVAPSLTKGVGALRGRRLDRDLRRLVRSAAHTTAALDRPSGELRGLVSGAAATLQTVAARRVALQETLRRSPAASDLAVSVLRRLDRTVDLAAPLVADLRAPAKDVAPTFAAVRPVLQDADALLDRARPLLRSLRPAAAGLRGAARDGLPLVKDLGPSLDRLEKTIIPMLAEKDPGTTKSTAVMIGGAVAGLASGAGGQMDANGHFIRFPATSGSSPVASIPCQTYLNNPDKAEMLACQSLQTALKTYLSYQPLSPTPGTTPGPRRAGG